ESYVSAERINVSIEEPASIRFNITFTNNTPVLIRWYIDGTQNVSAQNKSFYNWTGNYTQAGNYLILVNISNNAGYSYQFWNLTVLDADQTPPGINFTQPTLGNNTIQTQQYFDINVSIKESSLKEIIYNWNGTNYSIYNDSLVLMYNFDNVSALGEGTSDNITVDLSGYGNNGTIYNMTEVGGNYTTGKYRKGLSFDGVDDYVTRASTLWGIANAWSVSVWYKQSVAADGLYIWNIGDKMTDNDPNEFKLVSNYVYIADNAGDYFKYYSGIPTFTDTWTHTTVTWDGTNLKVYQNGADITGSLTKTTDNAGTMTNTNRALWLGVYPVDGNPSNYYFKGLIDEVRIWNRTLSAAEIQILYMSNLKKYDSENWSLYVNQSKNSTTALTDGPYTYKAYAKDTAGNLNATETRTITIDTTPPKLTIISPTAITHTTNRIEFNISANEQLDSCHYSIDNWATNVSMVAVNTTYLNKSSTITDGTYTAEFFCNDTLNNINMTENVTFTIDTGFPQINFTQPTPGNNTMQTQQYFDVNISIKEALLEEVIYNWNGTNYTLYNDSLVLMMNFDNVSALGEGTSDNITVDLSRYGNNGTIYNMTEVGGNYTAGRYGNGLSFDGVDDYVVVADESDYDFEITDDFLLSAWIKASTSNSMDAGIIAKYNTSSNIGLYTYIDYIGETYKLYLSLWNAADNRIIVRADDTTLNDNNWHHIAIFYDGNSDASGVQIYIDGVNETIAIVQDTLTNSILNNEYFTIGGRGTSGSGATRQYFNGTIDEVRIWNRTLSASEIQILYMSNLKKYDTENWTLYVNQSLNSTDILPDDAYTYYAYAKDTAGNLNSTEVRTITIDTTTPKLSIISPTVTTYATSRIEFNISANEQLDSCHYSIDNWVTNVSMVAVNATYYNKSSTVSDGTYTAKFFCNDTLNNINMTQNVTFTVDTTASGINFTAPTPGNNTLQTQPYFKVNVSIKEPSLKEIIYNWNGTNYTIYNDSLVLMYNFDNVSGLGEGISDNVTVDLSRYGNDGTIHNMSAVGGNYTTGKYGKGLSFDGIDDYIEIPNSASLTWSDMTFSVWFKLDKNDVPYNLIGKVRDGSTTDSSYYLGVTSDNEIIYIPYDSSENSDTATTSGADLAADTWYHVVAAMDDTAIKIYLNGVLLKTAAVSKTYGTGNAALLFGDSPAFRYYRWDITDGNDANIYVGQFQIYDGSALITPSTMTATSVPSPYVVSYSASWEGDENWRSYFAMDSIIGSSPADGMGWNLQGNVGWYEIDLGRSYKVTSYKIYSTSHDACPRTWTFEGSHTGDFSGEEVILDSRANINDWGADTAAAYSTSINRFNGTIDEVRIWNRSLTASEIQIFYKSNLKKYDLDNWSFFINQTKNSTAVLTDGAYTYLVFAKDTVDNLNQTETRTITIDNTAPQLTIISPALAAYTGNRIEFNISANEQLDSCHYSIDNWLTNVSLVSVNTTYYNRSSTIFEGTYTAKFFCNDTLNNINMDEYVTFAVDTIYPKINFTQPTPGSAASIITNSVTVNVSITDSNLHEVKYDWDGTNETTIKADIYNLTANFTIVDLNTFSYNNGTTSVSFFDSTLVMMFNFDNVSVLGESNAYVVDLSEYGNDGIVSGSVWNSSGKYGGAMQFDGNDDVINLTTKNINQSAGTVSMWIKPAAAGDDNKNYTYLSTPSEISSAENGLVLLMHFNNDSMENDTHVYDWSGNGYNGTSYINNSDGSLRGPDAEGKYGGAYEFDSVDDVIEIPKIQFTATQSFSICSWVKVKGYVGGPGAFGVYGRIIALKSGGGRNYELSLYEGSNRVFFTNCVDGADTWGTSGVIVNNKWYFVCGVHSDAANSNYIYTNGALDTSKGSVGDNCDPGMPYTTIGAGSETTFYTGFFNGTIDEVAIWNRSLTAPEIKDMYLGGLSLHKDTDNNLRFHVGNETLTTSISAWSADDWHHVTATFDENTGVNLYVDGSKQNTKSGFTAPGIINNISYLGNDEISRSDFNGKIDEFRVWSRNLSTVEVNQLYASNLNKYASDKWQFYINQSTGGNYSLEADGAGKINFRKINASDYNLYLNKSSLVDGTFSYQAFAHDLTGKINQTEERTVTINVNNPKLTIISPTATTYTTSRIEFNISGNEQLDVCLYSIDNWATNVSMAAVNTTYFNKSSAVADGTYTAKFFCNDTINNINMTENVTFTIDATTYPKMNFTQPTPGNATVNSTNSVRVNVSIIEPNLDEVKYNWNRVNETTINIGANNLTANFTIADLNNLTYNNGSQSAILFDSSLILMLNFDNVSALGENSTYVVDVSGNGNNGTVIGAVVNSSGKYGKGFTFNGDDYITIPDKDMLDGMITLTVSAWIYPRSFSNSVYGTIIQKSDAVLAQYTMFTSGSGDAGWINYGIWAVSPAGWNWVSASGVKKYEWSFMTLVYNGSQMVGYVNGAKVGNKSVSGAITKGTLPLVIGAWYNLVDHEFNGTIDEVSIWNRSLSANEIRQLYLSNLNKYDTDKWQFYINQSTGGNYYLDVKGAGNIYFQKINASNYLYYSNKSSLVDGTYTYHAYAKDKAGNLNQTETRYITINANNPRLTIISPTAKTYTTNRIEFNISGDDHLDTCHYSIDSWATNVSMVSVNATYFNKSSVVADGSYTVKFWCNDTLNHINMTQNVTFTVDTTAPNINFTQPTPGNNTMQTQQYFNVNVSITESSLKEIIYNWNGTNYTIYNDSLVLMMNFDNVSVLGENSTHVVDLGIYSINGTWNGGGRSNGTAKYGSYSGSFDGNDYVAIADNENLNVLNTNNYAIQAWYKYTNAESGNDQYDCILNRPSEFYFDVHKGGGGVRVSTEGGNVVQKSYTFSAGRWYHIIASNNGGTVTIYVNGRSIGSGALASATSSGDVYIGGFYRGGWLTNEFVVGSIDEVRIWDLSLTQDEVQLLYMSNLQKYDNENWSLYVNQSLNSTAVLTDGTYTYKAYAKDTAGNINSTEERTITIQLPTNITNLYPNRTLGESLDPANLINISIIEPNNITFNITYTGSSVTINWTVNGTEKTSFRNKARFNWTGNFTQAGDYLISVNVSNSVGHSEKSWILTVNESGCGDTLTVSTAVLINSSSLQQTCYQYIYIQDGGTLTANVPLFVNKTMIVYNGGTLTHTAGNMNRNDSINITVKGNLTIESGGLINVTSKGYAGGACATGSTASEAGSGPGGGGGISGVDTQKGGGGAGYAGFAGYGISAWAAIGGTGGNQYGSFLAPTELGSGGGGGQGFSTCTNGGNGGGAVFINITNILNISGNINANGITATSIGGTATGGGGSGGSIYLLSNIFTGNGSIASDGGSGGDISGSGGAGGGASGGRIAIYYTTKTYIGTITAYGGAFGTGSSNNGIPLSGAAGTIYFNKSGASGFDLILSGGPSTIDTFTSLGTNNYTINNLTINNAKTNITGSISVTNKTLVIIDSTLTISSGNLTAADALTVDNSTLTIDYINVGANNITLFNSKINVEDIKNSPIFNLSSSTLSIFDSNSKTMDSIYLSNSVLNYSSGTQLFVNKGITLSGTSTLTISYLNISTLTIPSGSTITHQPNNTLGLNITAINLTIESGGSINLSGKGYTGGACTTGATASGTGSGPGGGGGISGVDTQKGGGGAGYGGYGGYGISAWAATGGSGGSHYGSLIFPIGLGSGGGGGQGFADCSNGGNGGGAVFINVTDTLNISGNIYTDGISAISFGGSGIAPGGGGSGGGVYIVSNTFTGYGSITSDGGRGGDVTGGSGGAGGGASGGRIAIYYSTKTYTGTTTAYGGRFGTGASNNGIPQTGAAGTIYLKQNSNFYFSLVIDNNNRYGGLTPINTTYTNGTIGNLTIVYGAIASFKEPYYILNATGTINLTNSTLSVTSANTRIHFKFNRSFIDTYTTYPASFKLTYENSSAGKIFFVDAVTGIENLSINIKIRNNSAFANSSEISGLNKYSNITLYSIGNRGFAPPKLYRDASFCTDCYNFTSLEAQTVIFNVTGFSNYSIGDGSTVPVINSSRLFSETNTTFNVLAGYCNATDEDLDNLIYYYKWYRNGTLNISGKTATSYTQGTEINVHNISSINLTVGDNWTLGCLASDGDYNSSWLNSSSVLIIPAELQVTLNLPIDLNHSVSLTDTITFNCSAIDSNTLTNISLYSNLNASAGWSRIANKSLTGNSNSTVFALNTTALIGVDILKDSAFKWNCLGYDSTGLSDWGNSNFTFSGWNLGTYGNTTFNTSGNFIGLLPNSSGLYENKSGNYTSRIFNATYTASWKNISWDVGFNFYNRELPGNMEDETLTYSDGVNMSGNVLLMHFNNDSVYENSTHVYDWSGNDNNGTLYGTGRSNGTGKLGTYAATFHGIEDYLNVSSSTGDDLNPPTQISITAWIKRTLPSKNEMIVARMDTSTTRTYYLGFTNDELQMEVSEDGTTTDREWDESSSVINDINWHHVAGTFDGSVVRLYIDGVDDTDGSPNGDATSIHQNPSDVIIGYDVVDASRHYNGTIDELAIWNRSLSAAEIQNIYKRGALRLNLSARTCNDPACDTETFTNLGSNNTLTDISSLTSNQYFQYKFNFETDDANYTPQLTTNSVTIGYELTPPTITNLYPNRTLGESLDPADLINISIKEPNNITFNITYTGSNVNINWSVNGSDQSNFRNKVRFNWSGNYTQAGDYLILVNVSNAVSHSEKSWILTVNESGCGDTLTVSTTILLNSSSLQQTCYQYIYIQDGGTLTSNVPLTVTKNLFIYNGGTLTHTAGNMNRNDTINITVKGNLTIEAGGIINVTGKGYAGGIARTSDGSGPGGGKKETSPTGVEADGGGGAGYGGYGGKGGYRTTDTSGRGGASYGPLTKPTYLGSGGGGGYATNGANGGGAIILNITGMLNNSGLISADGSSTYYYYPGSPTGTGGGGSGGSIYIVTGNLAGNGSISSKGGYGGGVGSGGAGGGASGGRIALYYTGKSYTGTFTAYGGAFGTGSSTANGQSGAAGTIYLNQSSKQYFDLIIDNGPAKAGVITPLGHNNYTIGNLTINTAQVNITGTITVKNNTLKISNSTLTIYFGNLSVISGSNVTFFESVMSAQDMDSKSIFNFTDSTITLSSDNIRFWTSAYLSGSTVTFSLGSLNITSDFAIKSTILSIGSGNLSLRYNNLTVDSSTITAKDIVGPVIYNFTGSTITLSTNNTRNWQSVSLISTALTLCHLNISTLTVHTGSVLSHPSGNPYGLNITAKNLTIEAGGMINVTGKGYAGGIAGTSDGSGPGGGKRATSPTGIEADGGGGAGYGGYGGKGGYRTTDTSGSGGSSYGSLTKPLDLGSGGGSGYATNGAKGGGAIFLNITDILNNSGLISADGSSTYYYSPGSPTGTGGGGSGGSIHITAGNFVGNGSISSKGGYGGSVGSGGAGGGASGGRIALYYSGRSYTGTFTAYGGAFGTGSSTANGQRGAAGTIYLKQNSSNYFSLIIDNNNQIGVNTPINTTYTNSTIGNLTIVDAAYASFTEPLYILNATGTINLTNSTIYVASADTRIHFKFNRYFIDTYTTYPASFKLTYENSSAGKIFFIDAVTGIENLSSNIKIKNNSAYVNSSEISGLDKYSNITLYSIGNRGFAPPRLYRDASFCTDCYNFTSLEAQTVIFNVTGFSNYSIGEGSTVPIINSSRLFSETNTTFNVLAGYCNATDEDLDNLIYYYRWYRNGTLNISGKTATSYTQGTEINVHNISSINLTVGDNWTLDCLASDGDYNSSWLNSSSVLIIPAELQVTLNVPTDQNHSVYLTDTIIFNCSAIDSNTLTNISLYSNLNASAGWSRIANKSLTGNSNSTVFAVNAAALIGVNKFKDSEYKWNCLVYDSTGLSDWGNSNYTFSGWNLGTYGNTTYNISGGFIGLLPNSSGLFENRSGNYTSRVFNATYTATWKNISWDVGFNFYNRELPGNMEDETLIYTDGVNMSGNVLLMHFNNDSSYENSTHVYDWSGNDNNGTSYVNNSDGSLRGPNATGKYAGAYAFDGVDDYVSSGANTANVGTSDLTISTWVKWAGSGESYGGIVSNGPFQGGTNHYILYRRDLTNKSSIRIDDGTNSKGLTWGDVLESDSWVHVAVTVDRDGNVTGYSNGVKSESESHSVTGTLDSSENFYIGEMLQGNPGSTSHLGYFKGLIDEVAIWNRTLSADEILNIYRRGVLRLNLSARSCNDSVCDGESFTNLGSNHTLTNLSNLTFNQYFQYKFNFETDDANYTPELTTNSVTIGYEQAIYQAPNITKLYPNSSLGESYQLANLINISIAEPTNLTFNITYTGSSVTINWTVDSREILAFRNKAEFNWSGNYTQAGNYLILVNVSNNGGSSSNYWNMTVNNTNLPPITTLNSPTNNNHSVPLPDNIAFNCSAIDTDALKNISLYTNINGIWSKTANKTFTGTQNSTTFTVVPSALFGANKFIDSEFQWNCLVYDIENVSDWADSNFTFSSWNLGMYGNTTLNISNHTISLLKNSSGSYENRTGNYTSRIFNATFIASWQNISWDVPFYYYGMELASNLNNESGIGAVNMTDNVLLMHFNNDSVYENSTHIYDWSGNDNNGTAFGAFPNLTDKKIGAAAFEFDGTNDYIQINNVNFTGQANITISVWVKAHGGTDDYIIELPDTTDGSQGPGIHHNNGNISFQMITSSGSSL
ncbi:MAG: LamG-like jellyroll fold domain-containing protein, partial [Nanoarchaeota archaeon]